MRNGPAGGRPTGPLARVNGRDRRHWFVRNTGGRRVSSAMLAETRMAAMPFRDNFHRHKQNVNRREPGSVSLWISPAFASRTGHTARAGTRGGRMMDAEYLIERAHRELNAAMRTADLRVRGIHLELGRCLYLPATRGEAAGATGRSRIALICSRIVRQLPASGAAHDRI